MVVDPTGAVTKREAVDTFEASPPFQRAQEFAKCNFAFATYDEIHTRSLVRLGGKTRVIAAHNDFQAGLERSCQFDDATGRPPLKGHDRESNDCGIKLANQPGNSLPNPTIAEDQIRHGNLMVGIHIPGQRRQRAVGHADGDRGHVLEIIWHGEQEDVHHRLSYVSCVFEENRLRATPGSAGTNATIVARAITKNVRCTGCDIACIPRSLPYVQQVRSHSRAVHFPDREVPLLG